MSHFIKGGVPWHWARGLGLPNRRVRHMAKTGKMRPGQDCQLSVVLAKGAGPGVCRLFFYGCVDQYRRTPRLVPWLVRWWLVEGRQRAQCAQRDNTCDGAREKLIMQFNNSLLIGYITAIRLRVCPKQIIENWIGLSHNPDYARFQKIGLQLSAFPKTESVSLGAPCRVINAWSYDQAKSFHRSASACRTCRL